MTKVLVVDDDPSLLKALRIGLTARGDDVVGGAQRVRGGTAGRARPCPTWSSWTSDCPTSTGWRCAAASARSPGVPILVLSASGDERRKVEALDSGADDFVTKPFGMAELEARLRVALRHATSSTPDTLPVTSLRNGGLDIDLIHHMATLDGRPLPLTAKEFELLAYLARHAGKVCTHHMILKDVWGPGYGAESNYVRVYTHRLRKKLGDDEGRILRTVPGIGYQLVTDDHQPTPENS